MQCLPTFIPPHESGLPAVLQRVAEELAHLSAMADDIGVGGATDLERWQSLDRLSQHLGGLAAFLSQVSRLMPELQLDLGAALAAIKVGKLFDRLTARLEACDEAAGDFEAFGG